jgi:hypothetical protein
MLAATLVLLQLPVLAVLAIGWLVTGGIFGCLDLLFRSLGRLKSTARALVPRLESAMKTLGLGVVVLAVFAIGTLWVLSHLEPDNFGSCHPVALQIGNQATTRQCEAYSPPDFAVPLALVVLLIFLVSDDVKFGAFGWTIEKKAREAREKVNALQVGEPDIERRVAEFEQTIKPPRQ